MTLRINKMLCVSRYIRHRPRYMHARERVTRAGSGDVQIATLALTQSRTLLASMVCPAKCVSLSSSQFSEMDNNIMNIMLYTSYSQITFPNSRQDA